MKVKITSEPTPEMRIGGYFYPYPYAGAQGNNPFGITNKENYPISEDTNSTVKSVDKEDANIEAEEGEVLLKFDMGGLFNIKGKRHSQGGTPLVVDKGDFIFSRDNNLAITPEEKDLFDFKQKGNYTTTENTPAKLLNKEVDSKHYNQLLNILNNPNADDFSKKSAELMLGKYQQKIGQIAYLQESKKDFPQGIPPFAKGTAPVDAPEFDEAETKEMMYAKQGLFVDQPNFNPFINNGLINTPQPDFPGAPYNSQGYSPYQAPTVPNANPIGNITGTGFKGMNIPWNAQEMLTTSAPFLSALSTPTYYDQLQQKHTPDIRLDRLNNDAEVTAIKQQAALSQREIGANTSGKNSQLADAQIRAQALNQMAQSYAGINNANTQIANNETQTNYNSANSDQMFNLQNIYKTGVNNTLSQQRRQEQLHNAATDSLNKGIAVQNSLDTLNQNLSSQVMPYVDKSGNSPIMLNPNNRVAIANPNWHGDILNNPFIPSNTGRDFTSKLSDALNQAIMEKDNDSINAISRAIAAYNKQTRNQPSFFSRLSQ